MLFKLVFQFEVRERDNVGVSNELKGAADCQRLTFNQKVAFHNFFAHHHHVYITDENKAIRKDHLSCALAVRLCLSRNFAHKAGDIFGLLWEPKISDYLCLAASLRADED